MQNTTFTAWLRTQTHRNDPIGDLARDFTADPRARTARSPNGVQSLLLEAGACHEAHEACDAAAKEWQTR